ncbi:MAG: hypothetical protein RLZZ232_1928 [Planctomycetota bacterium]
MSPEPHPRPPCDPAAEPWRRPVTGPHTCRCTAATRPGSRREFAAPIVGRPGWRSWSVTAAHCEITRPRRHSTTGAPRPGCQSLLQTGPICEFKRRPTGRRGASRHQGHLSRGEGFFTFRTPGSRFEKICRLFRQFEPISQVRRIPPPSLRIRQVAFGNS